MKEEHQLTREQLALRIGAVCLIVGSVLVLVSRTLHGDLPAEQGGAASLNFVASYPIYRIVHLGDVLGFLVFASGLFVLADSLTQRVAWAVARLGAASVLVGVAVHITEFSIDGYALTNLANTWAAGSASAKPNLELSADVALTMLGGPATMALSLVWGVTLVLYGFALKNEGFSVWLAWTGVVLGAALFIMATTQFLTPNIFPGVLLFGGGTWAVHVWAVLLGIAMWRRAGTVAARYSSTASRVA